MRLLDLDPKLVGTLERGTLVFDCPCGDGHRLRIPVHRAPAAEVDGQRHWQAAGADLASLTLSPSVNVLETDPETGAVVGSCWHGHVIDGAIR